MAACGVVAPARALGSCSSKGGLRLAATPVARRGAALAHERDCAGFAARRLADFEETKEYKLQRLAEILHTDPGTLSNIVRLRPGLLVVSDMAIYERKVEMIAYQNGISAAQAAQMARENPQLLFQRA